MYGSIFGDFWNILVIFGHFSKPFLVALAAASKDVERVSHQTVITVLGNEEDFDRHATERRKKNFAAPETKIQIVEKKLKLLWRSGLPDFSQYYIPRREKIY
jgi:hypothetical protein